MILDLEKLLEEEIELKNEMHSIFKKLENGYGDMLKVYEKFEKPIEQISETLKEYARQTAENQQDSPFFNLAKKYETLLDSQKQLIHDVEENVVNVLQNIIQKSEILNIAIKELNSNAKNARKLKNKIDNIVEDIEDLQVKGKAEKIPKKESEKKQKETEFSLAKDRLTQAKTNFDSTLSSFNVERDELLKGALVKLANAEKTYVEAAKEVVEEQKETAGKL